MAAVGGTLIKLTNPYSKDTIVNTASWHFVSAELQGDQPNGPHRLQELVEGFDEVDKNA